MISPAAASLCSASLRKSFSWAALLSLHPALNLGAIKRRSLHPCVSWLLYLFSYISLHVHLSAAARSLFLSQQLAVLIRAVVKKQKPKLFLCGGFHWFIEVPLRSASSLLPTLHSAIQQGEGSGEVEGLLRRMRSRLRGSCQPPRGRTIQGLDFSCGKTRNRNFFSLEALH